MAIEVCIQNDKHQSALLSPVTLIHSLHIQVLQEQMKNGTIPSKRHGIIQAWLDQVQTCDVEEDQDRIEPGETLLFDWIRRHHPEDIQNFGNYHRYTFAYIKVKKYQIWTPIRFGNTTVFSQIPREDVWAKSHEQAKSLWPIPTEIKNLLSLSRTCYLSKIGHHLKECHKWTLVKKEVKQHLLENQGFVIAHAQKGYYDGNWFVFHLASAKLYESFDAAAQRARRSLKHYLNDLMIGEVQLKAQHFKPHPKAVDQGLKGMFADAKSVIEKDKLDVLQEEVKQEHLQASIQEKLDELELIKKDHPEWFVSASVPVSEKPAAASSKKRRL